MTVPSLLAARAAADPTRACFVGPGTQSLTFAEWDLRSNAVANQLLERKLRRGDRVVLLFRNQHWIDFATSYCGVLKAGGVAVPLVERLPPASVRNLVTHCGAVGVITDPEIEIGATSFDGVWHATSSALEAGATTLVDVNITPGDSAQILYTSGTTGRAKGVCATHENVAFGCGVDTRRRRLAHSEHFVHAFPIGTNAGQTMLINALDAKPAAVTAARFTPGHFARLIQAHAAGTVFVVPAMAIELLDARVHERYDLGSVVLLGSTAAPLPAPVATRLAAAFPKATIVNYYTSTEAAPAQTTMVFDPERPDSVGRSLRHGDLVVTDASGLTVPHGTPGEVWLRSPTTSRSYYADAAATAEVFRHGRVRMGDLGYLDADGYLYLLDRESDVIKSGAFKISTLQVETALYEHPAVAEAAVVGARHAVMGTVICAAVVAKSPVTLAEIRAAASTQLTPHEMPVRLLVLDSLPRNAGGKVVKSQLRAMFESSTSGEAQ